MQALEGQNSFPNLMLWGLFGYSHGDWSQGYVSFGALGWVVASPYGAFFGACSGIVPIDVQGFMLAPINMLDQTQVSYRQSLSPAL